MSEQSLPGKGKGGVVLHTGRQPDKSTHLVTGTPKTAEQEEAEFASLFNPLLLPDTGRATYPKPVGSLLSPMREKLGIMADHGHPINVTEEVRLLRVVAKQAEEIASLQKKLDETCRRMLEAEQHGSRTQVRLEQAEKEHAAALPIMRNAASRMARLNFCVELLRGVGLPVPESAVSLGDIGSACVPLSLKGLIKDEHIGERLYDVLKTFVMRGHGIETQEMLEDCARESGFKHLSDKLQMTRNDAMPTDKAVDLRRAIVAAIQNAAVFGMSEDDILDAVLEVTDDVALAKKKVKADMDAAFRDSLCDRKPVRKLASWQNFPDVR